MYKLTLTLEEFFQYEELFVKCGATIWTLDSNKVDGILKIVRNIGLVEIYYHRKIDLIAAQQLICND